MDFLLHLEAQFALRGTEPGACRAAVRGEVLARLLDLDALRAAEEQAEFKLR